MHRRSEKDRRARGKTKSFPLRDSGGQWIQADRRVLAGRRSNSIECVRDELGELFDLSEARDLPMNPDD
jgi:hypothetical protein